MWPNYQRLLAESSRVSSKRWRFGLAPTRLCGQYLAVDAPIELRQLRYFVAVAEELHFGRAAQRLHMSQSPLSRAIRELERDLGVVLFVRTTRRVELSPAGSALLVRARRALAEVDLGVDDARHAARVQAGIVRIGYGPLSRAVAMRIAEEVAVQRPDLVTRLEEDTTPELLRMLGAHDLVMAAVFETPPASLRGELRIVPWGGEALLAALPRAHRYASADAIRIGAFVAECVLLPREPMGRPFNAWLRAVMRAEGFELEHTRETLSAPWDHHMRPVADGETVAAFVGDWLPEAEPEVVGVPFDPPITFPLDLAAAVSDTAGLDHLLQAVLDLRDREGWLTRRRASPERPTRSQTV
jgi:DNA-binding transcriptional LysR family regulator